MARSSTTSVPLETFFAALADRTRLRLLNLMRGREVCVCYFVEILGESQPKISRHLAYLRKAGIVRARREGKWMHYRIERHANPAAEAILESTLQSLKEDQALQAEREQLLKACCDPGQFVTLAGAPVPARARHKS